MIVATNGINWFFPYNVVYEDDCIMLLKELPRQHRYEQERGADLKVDKWVEMDKFFVYAIGEQKKLYELVG